MAERFRETINLQPVDTRTGAAQAALSLADQLEDFKTLATQAAGQQALERGTTRAAGTELVTKDGITQAPKLDKVGFFGSIEATAHNKALRGAYLASLSNDITESVNRLETENPADLLNFNDSVRGLSKGILSGVDPSARQDVSVFLDGKITAARTRVHRANRAADRVEATAQMQLAANNAADESQAAARDGDLIGSGEKLLEFNTIIDTMVESGLMTVPEAEVKRRDADFNSTKETLLGGVNALIREGKINEAIEVIEKTRDKIPGGFTTDEHDEVVGGMIAELNESISLSNKIEDGEDAALKTAQENSYAELFTGIASGTATAQDVIKATKSKAITVEQGSKLLTTLNSRGKGSTDWSLVLGLHQDIREGRDVTGTVIANVGSNLTETQGLQILDRQLQAKEARVNSKHFTNDPNYKQAESFVRRKMRVTGPFGALDTEAESRLADAERELFESVRAGENPWAVADLLIGLDDVNQAPNPMFGSKENLDLSLERLNEAKLSNQIDDDTYNFEFRKIERLQQMIAINQEYTKARKAAADALRR
jgi:hypothetical protein